jgi:rfaE bifunctional protein nucleotidyltransferase chain/domain
MREVDLGRVLAPGEVVAWAAERRSRGLTLAFTNGCFDLLHAGHLWSLAEAARHAEGLLVAINSDASVRELKGAGRPLVPEDARAALLAALRPVSAVTIFAAPTPLQVILDARPDVLVKGSEYEESEIVGAQAIASWGGKVVRVPMRAGWSTSSIIESIKGSR